PRDGALRRRPRPAPPGVARARAARAAGTAVDRRRRRARVGARPQRPLRRGAALLAARAQARHARHGEALPPRRDRALPRPRPAPVGPPCARAQPPLLAAVGAHPEEARVMTKRLLLLVTPCSLACAAAAPAHPLGHS